MRLFNPDSTHWYDRDGMPKHTVPDSKGEPRSTTLRDARKLDLLPSVTNVLGVIAKPELTGWLQSQAVMAALTLPRGPEEDADNFALRVVADAQSTRDQAACFGTAIHHGAEIVARTGDIDPASPEAPWLDHYRAWFRANAIRLGWTEKPLVNLLDGYAGTADLLIKHQAYGLTLLDIKTQGVKPEARPVFYKSWCYQLAAYRAALGQPVACINLVFNSREPGPPVEHLWDEDDIQKGWRAFQAAMTIWMVEKNFDPRKNESE